MRKESGFSLMEVMAAIFLLGLAVVALAWAFHSAIGLKEKESDQTFLPMLAQEKLESILAGDERAEEGNLDRPWQNIHWRLEHESSPEGLTVVTLRLTRRDQVGRTLYSISATRLEKERE